MIKLIGDEAPVKLNRLAREECKLRLLQDILFDLQVCEIEQWDKLEYLMELKNVIDSIIKKEVAGCNADCQDGIPPNNKLLGILPNEL